MSRQLLEIISTTTINPPLSPNNNKQIINKPGKKANEYTTPQKQDNNNKNKTNPMK